MKDVSRPPTLRILAAMSCSGLLGAVILTGTVEATTVPAPPPPMAPWRDFDRTSVVALVDCGEALELGVATTCSLVRAWKGVETKSLVLVSGQGIARIGGGEKFLVFLAVYGEAGRVIALEPSRTEVVPLRSMRAVGEYLGRRQAAAGLGSDSARSESYWTSMAELARSPDPLIRRWATADLAGSRSPWNHAPRDLEPFVELAVEPAMGELALRSANIVLRAVEDAPTLENQRMLARMLRGAPEFATALVKNWQPRGFQLAEPILDWLREIADDPAHPYADVALQKIRDSAPGAPGRTIDSKGVLSRIELELLPAAATQVVGEPVLVGVRVRNATTQELRIVPPTLGHSVTMKVQREYGTEVPLRGEIARPNKRRVTELLGPGSGVTHVVSVASVFPMNAPGVYRVSATYAAAVPADEHSSKPRRSDEIVDRTVTTTITMLAPATEADRAGAAVAFDDRGLVRASAQAWDVAPGSVVGQGSLVGAHRASGRPCCAFGGVVIDTLAPHYQALARAEYVLAQIAVGEHDKARRMLAEGEPSPLMVDAVRKALRASAQAPAER